MKRDLFGTVSAFALIFLVAAPGARAQLAGSPWPMFCHDQKHTGLSGFCGAYGPRIMWSYMTGAPVLSSPAIGDYGTVYVGARDNNLYSIDNSGALVWSYRTGYWVDGSPAIDTSGSVFVGSDDNRIYRLQSLGVLEWSYETGGPAWSPPSIGTDGKIYAGSRDNFIYILYPSGALSWSYETAGWVESSPAIDPFQKLYFGSQDSHVYALNSTGYTLWSYSVGYPVYSSFSIGPTGYITVGSSGLRVYRFSSSGSLFWSYEVSGSVNNAVTLDSNEDLLAGAHARFYRLNSIGLLKWSYETGDWFDSAPTADIEGAVYVGSRDNRLYSLTSSGFLRWSFATGGEIYSSAAIDLYGATVFGSSDGVIYALNDLRPTPTPAAPTPTPYPTPIPGNFAYVTCPGTEDNPASEVYIIDLDAHRAVGAIAAGSRPQGIALHPAGQLLYVANAASDSVSVIHRGVNGEIAVIPVGRNPYGIAFSPDGSRAYVTCAGPHPLGSQPGTVSVIETSSKSVVAEIGVGHLPWLGILADPGSEYLFVSNRYSNEISVIDRASNTVAWTISSWDGPVGLAMGAGDLFCANVGRVDNDDCALANIDWETGMTRQRLETIRPLQLLYTAGIIYTTDYFQGAVSEVAADDFEVLETYDGFSGPDGIAAGKDSRYLYVADFGTPNSYVGAGLVGVIDRWSGEVAGYIPVGRNPANIAVVLKDPPVCPEFTQGGNICVEEPEVFVGGTVTMTYAILPGLYHSMDAMLGVLTPWGDIYAFNRRMRGIRRLPPAPRAADIDRVGRGIDGTAHRTGMLTFPIPAYVPPGDYRFIGALAAAGTDRVLQVVTSNIVTVR